MRLSIKQFYALQIVGMGFLLSACSLQRSDDWRVRIQVAEGARNIRYATKSVQLFDEVGHPLTMLGVGDAGGAGCVFVGMTGPGVAATYRAADIKGLNPTCPTIEQFGQVSNLATLPDLKDTGIAFSTKRGARALTLFVANLRGVDGTRGCPVQTLPEVFSYDRLATVFNYASSNVVIDESIKEITLDLTPETQLKTLLDSSCYDTGTKAPTSLIATAMTTTSIALKWLQESPNASGFIIERSLDNSEWTTVTTVAATQTSYLDTKLVSDTPYSYRVLAYNVGGNTPPSDRAQATTLSHAPSGAYSKVEVAKGSTPTADGAGQALIEVTVLDAYFDPVADVGVTLVSSRASDTVVALSSKTDSNGKMTFSVTSELGGSSVLTASIPARKLTLSRTAEVLFPGKAYSSTSSIAGTSGITADGVTTASITITLKDANGSAISGVIPEFSATGSNNTLSGCSMSSTLGVSTCALASTKAEIKNLKITSPGGLSTLSINVTFVAGNAASNYSSISATNNIPADGTSTSTITATLNDSYNNPISGLTPTLTASGSLNSFTACSSTNSSGVSTCKLSSTRSETKTVTISSPSGVSSLTTAITFMAGSASTTYSLIASTTDIPADGVSASDVTLTLKDSNGNSISSVVPTFGVTGSDNTVGTCSATDSSGISTCKLYSTKAETKTLNITSPAGLTGITRDVNFVAGPASQIVFTTHPPTSSVTSVFNPQPILEIRDSNGNRITSGSSATANISLSIYSGPSTSLSGTYFMNAVAGAADFSGKDVAISTATGSYRLKATADIGAGLTGLSNTFIVNTGDPYSATSTIEVSSSNVTADGTSYADVTITLRDSQSNPLEGWVVQFASSGSSNNLTQPLSATNSSGRATGRIASQKAEVKTLSLVTPSLSTTGTVTFVAGSASALYSSISATDNIVANGTSTSAITVVLKDAYSNVVSGTIPTLSVVSGTGTAGTCSESSTAPGTYSCTLASTKAETKTVAITYPTGLSSLTRSVKFVAGSAAPTYSSISATSGITANGSSKSAITVVLRDNYDNSISGVSLVVSSTGSNNTLTCVESATLGTYNCTLSSTKAETKTISITTPSGLSGLTTTTTFVAGSAASTYSTLSATTNVIADGTSLSTITVTLKDAYNNPVSGSTPVVSATGTNNPVSSCTESTSNSGTYSCTFSSTKAEVKTLSLTSPSGLSGVTTTVTFVAGSASKLVFTSQPSSSSVSAAFSPQPIIEIRDAFDNVVTTGADATATITLSRSDSGSVGGTVAMSAVSGIANFSGKGVNIGTIGSYILVATKSSTSATGSLTVQCSSFTISDVAPVLSSATDRIFPGSPLNQGTEASIDFNNTAHSPADDVGMTYTCFFDQIVDGIVNDTNACANLAGTASIDASTGIFSWTPNKKAWGAYELKVAGTNGAGTSSKVFVIDVRPGYTTTNLIGDWDAQFANYSAPHAVSSTNLVWRDLTATNHGTNSDSTYTYWTGDGSYTNPHALLYTGFGTTSFGSSVLSSDATQLMFHTWIAPTASSSGGTFIVGNSAGATGNGFTLRQSRSKSEKLEFVMGRSYEDVVLGYSPVLYLRLGETSGTSALDISTFQNKANYLGDSVLGAAGALTSDGDTAVTLSGSTGSYVKVDPLTVLNTSSQITLSAWMKSTVTNEQPIVQYLDPTTSPPTLGPQLWQSGTKLTARFYKTDGTVEELPTRNPVFTADLWYHVAATYDGTTIAIYVNGSLKESSVVNSITLNTALPIYVGHGYSSPTTSATYFNGTIDEVSVFNTALSATQIAELYDAGNSGSYGAICYTTSKFSNSTWNFVGGLLDGSTAKLFVNGRKECEVALTAIYPVQNSQTLIAGGATATSNRWSGSIADLKLYGTSSTTAVGTSTNIKTNFDATADRFRQTPVGNLVTEGLVLFLDAANGLRGMEFPGVSSGVTSWFDLSSTALTATLSGFSGNAGWNGTGTTSDRYRVEFDGYASNSVSVSHDSALNLSSAITVAVWVKPSSVTHTNEVIMHKSSSNSSDNGWSLSYATNSTGPTFNAKIGSDYINSEDYLSASTLANDEWVHIVGTYDGSTLKTYVNGSLSGSYTLSGSLETNTYPITIGGNFAGALTKAAVYNRALTASEIQQNNE